VKIEPNAAEQIRLLRPARDTGGEKVPEVLSQFHSQEYGGREAGAGTGDRELVTIRHYRIEATLAQKRSGDLDFSAVAEIEIAALQPDRYWMQFSLFSELMVDSAKWEDGSPANVYKGKDISVLWVRADSALQMGQPRRLTLYYHGDLIDREGGWVYLKSTLRWYPNTETRSRATFDLTFHHPRWFGLVSVGERVAFSEDDDVITSRWVTQGPIRNAGFNVGIYDEYEVDEEGLPAVTLLISEEGHRDLRRVLASHRGMKKEVGGDMANSMAFFERMFGEPPVSHLYVTETPYTHGLAFPGLVHLSWTTFQSTDREGGDVLFRAHEVAHQWWGVGVDFATYHDQWLSEGLAEFSGLWYLQTQHKNNDKYFGMLERWSDELRNEDNRTGLLSGGQETGPIWLGYRNNSSTTPGDYSLIVYRKGAWIMHMLRVLMLDLRTVNEDRFTNMMRDFYGRYRGQRASTEDFQRVVEQHAGINMDWFFRQWVYDTEIPEYRWSYNVEEAEGGRYRVQLKVEQNNVPDDFRMYVPVSVDLGNDRWARLRLLVEGPVAVIELPLMPYEPRDVKFNDLQGVLCEEKEVRWRD
ncbi:MAG: M1 family aminopeptidase, partial [Acidimicrobiia bacterium]